MVVIVAVIIVLEAILGRFVVVVASLAVAATVVFVVESVFAMEGFGVVANPIP